MKFKKEILKADIKNAVRGNSSFSGGNVEDAVTKLFKEKMIAFIDDVSDSLNRRDSEYSRIAKTIMSMKQDIKEI
jgi:hypothetical protein